MALPRLSGGVPVILALSWSNGIPRLWDTCTAATNCPRFLKPCEAVCRSVPAGSRLCSLLASLVLLLSLSETEDWLPWVLVVVVDLGEDAWDPMLPLPCIALDAPFPVPPACPCWA